MRAAIARRWAGGEGSDRAFLGASALVFAVSVTTTVRWCASMSDMVGMEMPGGWTMSMAWMRMPGQSWTGATATFLGMWCVMMIAMMLPSLVPTLWRYRQAVSGVAGARLGSLTAIVGAGYFFVWTLLGLVVFPTGVALAAVEMRSPMLSRSVPIASGVIVLMAGLLQFTAWKEHQLACCRGTNVRERSLPSDASTAWRHGLRSGIHCVYCCAGLMAILLVIGVMDPRGMVIVAAGITLERIGPAGARLARVVGVVIGVTGLFMLARVLLGVL
jgi:predicted metal-binding membrane protein